MVNPEITTTADTADTADSTTTVNPHTASKLDDSEKTPIIRYVLYAVMLVCIIALVYYSYNRFQDNKNTADKFTNEQERDDPQSDYNLHEAIRELKQLQNDIVGTLSNDTGI